MGFRKEYIHKVNLNDKNLESIEILSMDINSQNEYLSNILEMIISYEYNLSKNGLDLVWKGYCNACYSNVVIDHFQLQDRYYADTMDLTDEDIIKLIEDEVKSYFNDTKMENIRLFLIELNDAIKKERY